MGINSFDNINDPIEIYNNSEQSKLDNNNNLLKDNDQFTNSDQSYNLRNFDNQTSTMASVFASTDNNFNNNCTPCNASK